MPDTEETAQSATPVAESDQPTSQETELPSLADALRAQAQETQPQTDDGDELDDDDSADDTQATDAEPSDQDEAAKDADSAKQPSRPNQARRLKQRVTELESESQQHRERADRLEQESQNRQAEVMRLLGSDQEYSALIQKRLDPDQVLGWDEEQRYVQLTAERKSAALYYQQAQQGIRLNNEARVREIASKHGLNVDELAPLAADAGALLDKAISATEARVRAEMNDELERTKADRDSARLRLAGKSPDPGMGGRSGSHSPDHLNWDSAAPTDFFAEGMRQQARQPARSNGR